MSRILLIEDDDICRRIVEIMLKNLGLMDIVCAEDGELGLKLFDRMDTPPDVVISDIFMPNKDGIEIVNALVERKFSGGLILMSGADPSMVQIAQLIAVRGQLKILATLRKPLNEKALANVLHGQLPSLNNWFFVNFTVIICSLRDNPVFQNYQKHYEGHRAV